LPASGGDCSGPGQTIKHLCNWIAGFIESVHLEAGCILVIPALIFVSMTLDTVRQMPRSEKLKLMETLWEELSQPDTEFESSPMPSPGMSEPGAGGLAAFAARPPRCGDSGLGKGYFAEK
jgi:hypothetical protein